MKDSIVLQGRRKDSRKLLRDELGISDSALRAWDNRGLLGKGIKLGNKIFYDRELVEESLARGD